MFITLCSSRYVHHVIMHQSAGHARGVPRGHEPHAHTIMTSRYVVFNTDITLLCISLCILFFRSRARSTTRPCQHHFILTSRYFHHVIMYNLFFRSRARSTTRPWTSCCAWRTTRRWSRPRWRCDDVTSRYIDHVITYYVSWELRIFMTEVEVEQAALEAR